MNKVVLIGRLTSDPELKYVGEDSAVATFTLAVDKFVSGEKKVDFIRCKVWGKQAENLAEYQTKGGQLGVEGAIETGSYEDKEGNKKYTTEVRCNSIEYLNSKKTEDKPIDAKPSKPSNKYSKSNRK